MLFGKCWVDVGGDRFRVVGRMEIVDVLHAYCFYSKHLGQLSMSPCGYLPVGFAYIISLVDCSYSRP